MAGTPTRKGPGPGPGRRVGPPATSMKGLGGRRVGPQSPKPSKPAKPATRAKNK